MKKKAPKGYITIDTVMERLEVQSKPSARYWLDKCRVQRYDWKGPGFLYLESDIEGLLKPQPVEATA